MKKAPALLAALALLSLVTAGASAAPAHSPGQPVLLAAPYPIPPVTPSTPAAAAHTTAKEVAGELSNTTPAALGKGFIELPASASGPGVVSIVLSVKIHGRLVVIGSGRQSVDVAGALEVPLKLTGAGKSALAAHKRLKITVTVVFHAQNGTKKTASVKAALK